VEADVSLNKHSQERPRFGLNARCGIATVEYAPVVDDSYGAWFPGYRVKGVRPSV